MTKKILIIIGLVLTLLVMGRLENERIEDVYNHPPIGVQK